jgi:Na+(H+)/acetate symporter ActP
MDYVQALFGFFIIPLFGTVILGMLWKRATPAGGFWGLLCGTVSSILLWLLVKFHPAALAILASLFGRKADGREPVPVHLVLAGVRCRDHPDQPRDQTQAGFGTAGPGIRPVAAALRTSRPVLSTAHLRAAIVAAVFLCLTLIFW